MRRLVLVLCGISPEAVGRAAKQALAGCVLAAVLLSGCASQSTVAREWYEPTEATALKREYTRQNGAPHDDAARDHHQNDEPFLGEAALLREKQHLRTR